MIQLSNSQLKILSGQLNKYGPLRITDKLISKCANLISQLSSWRGSHINLFGITKLDSRHSIEFCLDYHQLCKTIVETKLLLHQIESQLDTNTLLIIEERTLDRIKQDNIEFK